MNASFLLAKKRDGGELTDGEIGDLVQGYVAGIVADYQMSAFAMAICCRGMSVEETASLTMHMLRTGVVLDWNDGLAPTIDKHSTGGIGDKVSLPLAAMLACCGGRVPMISGRGLGATGGTLDKLESIPGFRTDLSLDELRAVANRVGCVITGATADIAPADRKLYALRDVTGTVPSIPLITASIMSKKLAAGLRALVLDVKWGSGAFMKTLDQARALAKSLVATGQRMGVATTALVTDMNQPLGLTAGNALEVDESLAALEGRGAKDLMELTLALSAEVLVSSRLAPNRAAAETSLRRALDSGVAREKFAEMVAAQGGRLDAPRPVAPGEPLVATKPGFITAIDTEALGRAVIELGGGRRQVGDQLDFSVGLTFQTRLGDRVDLGQPLLLIHGTRNPMAARELLCNAVEIGDEPIAPPQLVVERVA